jgi:fatty-acyl-CoA synthase
MSELVSEMTCGGLILEAAAAHSDADAIVLPGDRVTYGGFANGAVEWSRVFMALGVMKGDHIGILLPNGTEFMKVLFGAMLAGAVPVPINTRYRGAEIAAMLVDADLVTVVTTNDVEQRPSLIQRLYEAFPDLPSANAPERLTLRQAPHLRNIIITEGPPLGFLHRSDVATPAVGSAGGHSAHPLHIGFDIAP